MPQHTAKSFEDDLRGLDNRISQMGGLVEQLLRQSFEALNRRDSRLASASIANDKAIDALQREIEDTAVVMIARRQ
jgi:phosphate transport system protein